MKVILLLVLLVICVATLLYLRWSDKVVASEMTPVSRGLLWVTTFFLGFGPLTLTLLKALRHYYGYDSSPLTIVLYIATVAVGVVLAYWVARWVVDVADD